MHRTRITQHLGDPTYLLVPLDTMDDSNDNEFGQYVDLQDYTHSNMGIHIQDKTRGSRH